MCGVVALVAPLPSAARERLVVAMGELLAHRGPDGSGVWSEGQVTGALTTQPEARSAPGLGPGLGLGSALTLGHRRLSIIDRSSAGAQPMHRGALTLSWNGELYNYLEKRAELGARGQRFTSQSDSEVLLAACESEGVLAALGNDSSPLCGMFAFALFDRTTRRLHLGRDRHGKKPLYYLHEPRRGIFAAASEPKALLFAARALELEIGVDRKTLSSYLLDLEYEVGTSTFFRQLRRVPAGGLITVELSVPSLPLESRVYYALTPERCTEAQGLSRAEADRRFTERLDEAVRLRLRSDVGVGACLSGGLDSSTVVTLASAARDVQLKTYSAIYRPDDPCDERRYIAAVVAHTGVKNFQVQPEASLAPEAFGRFLDHHDEPVGGTSVWAQRCVYGLASLHGTPVVLSGQGADEALTGYRGALPLLLTELLRRGQLGRLGQELLVGRASVLAFLRGLLPFLRTLAPQALGEAWLRHKWRTTVQSRPEVLALLVREDALSPNSVGPTAAGDELLPFPSEAPFAAAFDRRSLLHGYLYRLLTGPSLATILRYEDRNSMAVSVEARAPFLDHRLVEHCLSRSVEDLVEGGRTKALLRRALASLLPPAVRDRRDKVGFATPEARWLLGPLRPLVEDVLHSKSFAARGFLDAKGSRAAYQAAKQGAPFDAWELFKVVNVELWLRQKQLSV